MEEFVVVVVELSDEILAELPANELVELLDVPKECLLDCGGSEAGADRRRFFEVATVLVEELFI